MPLLINILAVFIYFLHWQGFWKSFNTRLLSIFFGMLSLFLWQKIKGIEFGLVYFLTSTSLISLFYLVEKKHKIEDLSFKQLITKNLHSRIKKCADDNITPENFKDYQYFENDLVKTVKNYFLATTNLFLLILIPFASAASLTLLLLTVIGATEANSLVVSLFMFIVIWSLLLTWVYMKTQRILALSILCITCSVSLISIYTSSNLSGYSSL